MKNNQQLNWQHVVYEAHLVEALEVLKYIKSRKALVTSTEVNDDEVVIRFTVPRADR